MIRLRILTAGLALALLFGGVAPVLSQMRQPGTVEIRARVTVPFMLSGNHIFVKALLNGKPYALIFDSAGEASLSPEAARTSPCPSSRSNRSRAPATASKRLTSSK